MSEKVKKIVFTEEQIITLAMALNRINVKGMEQAEALTICKQVLDNPLEIIEETEEKGETE